MVSTRSYHNCCTVEKLIMQGLERELEPGQLAALAKALDTILERKRILRMKPAPKPVDVSGPRKRNTQAPSAPIIYPDPAPSPMVMHDAAGAPAYAPTPSTPPDPTP